MAKHVVAGMALACALGVPAAAQTDEEKRAETLAAIASADREVLSATVEAGSTETISVAVQAAFSVEGLSEEQAEALARVMPFALARCIAADHAVKTGAAAITTLGGDGEAKLDEAGGPRPLRTAFRYGFRLGDDVAPDDERTFDAERMQADCARNESIPPYDVIGGTN